LPERYRRRLLTSWETLLVIVVLVKRTSRVLSWILPGCIETSWILPIELSWILPVRIEVQSSVLIGLLSAGLIR